MTTSPTGSAKARAIRRVLVIVAVTAVVELAIWLVFYRSPFLRPLAATPALLVLAGGFVWALHAWRHRRRARRRRGGRRANETRTAEDAPHGQDRHDDPDDAPDAAGAGRRGGDL